MTNKLVIKQGYILYLSLYVFVSGAIFVSLSSDTMLHSFQRRFLISGDASSEINRSFEVGRVVLYAQYLDVYQKTFPYGQGLGLPLAYFPPISGVPDFKSDISLVSFVIPFGIIGAIIYFVFMYKMSTLFNRYARVYNGEDSQKVLYYLTLTGLLISFNIDIISRNIFVVYLADFAVLYHVPSEPNSRYIEK